MLIRPLLWSADFSWDFVNVSHWTSVEVNTAIVCACLLAIRPLIDLLWSKLRRSSRRRGTSLASGPPTIGSESVRGSRQEGGYGSNTGRAVLIVTEAESFELPMGDVGQQYAAVIKDVSTAGQGGLHV